MASTEILAMIAGILGGLTFFLFGMSTMSGGLEKMAGGTLERTMKKVTANDVSGFFLGAGITIAIQSSSAMTVMLVGLVNSGIMGFADTFGMIMGSHVGTTLTAWITTLNGIGGSDNFFLTVLQPTTFAPILAFVGIAMRMFSNKERKKDIGVIFIGFAILMAGMSMMSAAVSGLKDNTAFQSMLTAFKSPAVALIVSTVFTGIIQSSAATVVIVQSLALTGTISYQVAIPLIIGANIGTCMTALISCIGTNREAKRVVAMHIYTNAIGGVVCVIVMYLVMAFKPELMANHYANIFSVAIIHSLFNIINTIAFIPFKKAVIRLCELTVKKDNDSSHTVFLDERLFNNTPLAISECKRLTNEMAELAKASMLSAINLIHDYSDEENERIRSVETLVDKYEDKLGTYLVRISSNDLSKSEAYFVGRMLHSIGDFERISDHAVNLCNTAQELRDKKIWFSPKAEEEIKVITSALEEILDITVTSFVNDDATSATSVEPLEQVIDKLKAVLKSRHIDRLQKGDCTTQIGFIFSDLLANYERVSDHCSNVAVYTMQLGSTTELDAHNYLNKYKSASNEVFLDIYNAFERKYTV